MASPEQQEKTAQQKDLKIDPSALSEQIFRAIDEDPGRVAFGIGILVGVLTLLILFVWRRGKSKRTILMAGPCGGGKTVMFGRLAHGKKVETFTSMKENFGLFTDNLSNPPKTYDLVDLPGHGRLRSAALDKYKRQAVAVLYVIDASTFKTQLRDSAEFLFQILSDPVLFKSKTPVLVACNKQDISVTAKGASVIEREMTKEIGLLRETHAKLLDGTNDTATATLNHMFLGREGKEFEFSDIRAKVTFRETSAVSERDADNNGIHGVRQWISSLP